MEISNGKRNVDQLWIFLGTQVYFFNSLFLVSPLPLLGSPRNAAEETIICLTHEYMII